MYITKPMTKSCHFLHSITLVHLLRLSVWKWQYENCALIRCWKVKNWRKKEQKEPKKAKTWLESNLVIMLGTLFLLPLCATHIELIYKDYICWRCYLRLQSIKAGMGHFRQGARKGVKLQPAWPIFTQAPRAKPECLSANKATRAGVSLPSELPDGRDIPVIFVFVQKIGCKLKQLLHKITQARGLSETCKSHSSPLRLASHGNHWFRIQIDFYG